MYVIILGQTKTKLLATVELYTFRHKNINFGLNKDRLTTYLCQAGNTVKIVSKTIAHYSV